MRFRFLANLRDYAQPGVYQALSSLDSWDESTGSLSDDGTSGTGEFPRRDIQNFLS